MVAPEHILISRTDSIGDVMLTLPMLGLLKERFPGVRITFMGRTYTAPVLRRCRHVDTVITLDEYQQYGAEVAALELRKQRFSHVIHVFPHREVASWCKHADIPCRIGTTGRWWHWFSCNQRVRFSRKRSDLHEAQLNLKLLAPFGLDEPLPLDRLAALSGYTPPAADVTVQALLRPDRTRIVLHTLSKGSAVEWGMPHFRDLIAALDPERYQVILTGTATEAERYRQALRGHLQQVTDAGGRLDLEQLMALIASSHVLVAASTGPLHLAAASGIRAIGLYATKRPIHPGRWAPIGRDVHALVAPTASTLSDPLMQVQAITPVQVMELIEGLRPR
jgi:heptosyltransferase III